MSLVAVGNLNQDALAQTDRDLLPVGMEFCMLATEDPVRADNFATASGFAARQINSNTTSYARSGEGPFMTARVYRQESGDFAVECGFRVDAVGEISSDEVSQLASRFGLEHIGPRGATHFMSRQTPHLITNVYARATDGIPCPGDGRLEIAPELLEEHPEVLDQVMQVCDTLGFEVVVQSAYSVSEIER
jgi:hypothetical protein